MTMNFWYPSTNKDTWSTIANRFGRASEIEALRQLNGGAGSPGERDILIPSNWDVYRGHRYFVLVPTAWILPVVRSPKVPDGVIQQAPDRDAVVSFTRAAFAATSSDGMGSAVYDFLDDHNETSKDTRYSGIQIVLPEKMVAMVRPPASSQNRNITQFILQHYRNRHFRAWHIKRLRGEQSYDEHGARANMTSDCPPLWWPVVRGASYAQVQVAPARNPLPPKKAPSTPRASQPQPPKPPPRETDPRFDADFLPSGAMGFEYISQPSSSGALSIIPWANATPNIEENNAYNTVATHPKLLALVRELVGLTRRAAFIRWMMTLGFKDQESRVMRFLGTMSVLVKCMDAAYKFGSKATWEQVATVRQALTKLILAFEERVDVTQAMQYAPDAVRDFNKAGAVIVERASDPSMLKALTEMTEDSSIPVELMRSAVQAAELSLTHSLSVALGTAGSYVAAAAPYSDVIVGLGSLITKFIGNQWGPSSLMFYSLNKNLTEGIIKATASVRTQAAKLPGEIKSAQMAIAALDRQGPAPFLGTKAFDQAEEAYVKKLIKEMDRADATGTAFNSKHLGPPPAREWAQKNLEEFKNTRTGFELKISDMERELAQPRNISRELLNNAKKMGWDPSCTEDVLALALKRAGDASTLKGRVSAQTEITELLTERVQAKGVKGQINSASLSVFGNSVLALVNAMVLWGEFLRPVSKELETLTGFTEFIRGSRRYVDKFAATMALANSGLAVASSSKSWIFAASRGIESVAARTAVAAFCTGTMGVIAAIQGIIAGIDDFADAVDNWSKPAKMFDTSFKAVTGVASIGVGVAMGVATWGWLTGAKWAIALGPKAIVAGVVLAVFQFGKSLYDVLAAEPGQSSAFTMGVRQLAADLKMQRMLDAGQTAKAFGVEAEVNALVEVVNKAVFDFPFWKDGGEVDAGFIERLRTYLRNGDEDPFLLSRVALPEDFVLRLVPMPMPLVSPHKYR